MGKTFKATWLGDEDPNQQIIHIGGTRFIKGEPTDVPVENYFAKKIRGNPMFSVEKDAEPVASDEPEAPDLLEGTELGAALAEAERLGIKLPANASLDTVRGKLAAHKEG